MGSILDIYSNALHNTFGGSGGSGNLASLYGNGLSNAYSGSVPGLPSLIGGLIQQTPGMAGDLGNWLHGLLGGQGQPFAGTNPLSSNTGGPAPAGSQMMTPTTYPSGSTMLAPGGTPATAAPVGGQPAAPSYGDMGANYLPADFGGAGVSNLSARRAAAQGQAQIDAMHQFVAQHLGLPPEAVSATIAALQRAAQQRASLLQ